jgi:GxxExxY protein
MNDAKLIHRELSASIIGAAMKVLDVLKPGLSEKAYENAMVIELRNRGHKVSQQERFEVRYEGQWVDTLVTDLIVDDFVIADSKVAEDFHPSHIAHMTG